MEEAIIPQEENRDIYVTVDSARKATYEVVRKYFHQWYEELEQQREELYDEILNTYLKEAIPTEEEKKILHLTRNLHVIYPKAVNNSMKYFDIYDLHKGIKHVNEPVEISLTHILALNELYNRSIQLKTQEENMRDRLFEEIMYTRDKEAIEKLYPKLMPLLEFKQFIYDTYFWKDIMKEEENKLE